VSERSELEWWLQRRIRFLIPTPLALFLMLGLAFLASDFLAMGALYLIQFIVIIACAIALLANIVYRRRAETKLKRLQSDCCINCGYDLRAAVERCSECGKRIPASS
jgi:hypothetical protein